MCSCEDPPARPQHNACSRLIGDSYSPGGTAAQLQLQFHQQAHQLCFLGILLTTILMISALCINLGKGKTEVSEGERSSYIESFVQQVAADHKPDVVFTQDAYSKKNLEKLIPALANNIEGSSFVLKKNVINDPDHVGIFLNENKFKIKNIEKECMQALQKLRLGKNDFFTEDKRAVFVLAETKTGTSRFLFSSFHAKKNNISDAKREIHIKEFFELLEMVAKLVNADHIVVGSDTNHRMKAFEVRNRNKKFCVKVILYDYPKYCARYIDEQKVYDFFMISPNLSPLTTDPKVFNEPIKYLDHHPIFMQFYYPINDSFIQKNTTTSTQELARLPTMFQTTDNVRQPIKDSTPPLQTRQHVMPNLNIGAPQPSQYTSPSSQYHTQASNQPKPPHQLYQTIPYQTANCAKTTQHEISTHPTDLHFLMKSKKETSSLGPPSTKPTQFQILASPGKAQNHINIPKNVSLAGSALKSMAKFKCELCIQTFPSKQGLLIHFGKQKATHFPCKEKFLEELDPNKNMCLRVFKSEPAVKSHKTKQMNNPRHHNPNQPFPNLI